MEESLVSGSLLDCCMAEPDQLLMKRPRSPTVMGRSRPASGAATSKPASSDSSRSSVDLPTFFGSSQGSSPGSISVSAPPSEGEVSPFPIPCLDGVGLLGVGGAGEREGGAGKQGGDVGLVPVEVRVLAGVRKGCGVLGRGSEVGERGAGGAGGELGEGRGGPGGLPGGVVRGGRGGGLEKGKETLVLVGVREVEALGLVALGGDASEREEGRTQGGGRAGRGRGSPGGGTGGWAVEVEAVGGGSSRDRLAVVRPRVRSRSPGGERRREGVLLRASGGGSEGVEGGSDGEGQQGGEHALAVEGVRGAVLAGAGGAGVGPDCGGASGSC